MGALVGSSCARFRLGARKVSSSPTAMALVLTSTGITTLFSMLRTAEASTKVLWKPFFGADVHRVQTLVVGGDPRHVGLACVPHGSYPPRWDKCLYLSKRQQCHDILGDRFVFPCHRDLDMARLAIRFIDHLDGFRERGQSQRTGWERLLGNDPAHGLGEQVHGDCKTASRTSRQLRRGP